MVNHDEFLPRLAAYHDGQLRAQDVQKIEVHLRECSACRQKLDDWRALDAGILSLPEPEPADDDAWSRALEEIRSRQERVARSAVRVVPIYRRRRALAAAAVLVIAGGALLMRQTRSPAPVVEDKPVVDPGTEPGMRVSRGTDSLPAEEGVRQSGDSTPATAPSPATPPQDRVEPAPVLARGPDTDSLAAFGTGSEPSSTTNVELAQTEPTVTAPVGPGDSGIPQIADWPARLLDTLEADLHYRLPKAPAPRLAELNLMHEFEIEFVGVGYAIGDLLNQGHDARLTEPTMLEPDAAYLVSNLRMERTALLARVSNQVLSAEVALRLAEVTWRLANITADYDDVKHAMVAQADAMRHRPELASRSRARIVRLQAMID